MSGKSPLTESDRIVNVYHYPHLVWVVQIPRCHESIIKTAYYGWVGGRVEAFKLSLCFVFHRPSRKYSISLLFLLL